MKSKSSPPKGKGKSADVPKILAVLMILGAVWLFFKKSRKVKPEQPAQTEAPAPKVFTSSKQLAQEQSENRQRTQLFVQERAAGLYALPGNRSEQGLALQVSSKAFERGCMQGDLDIIQRDIALRKKREPALRLSLENLDPASSMKPVQAPVSLAELKKGLNHTLKVPITPERSYWGLFLCSASSEKYCQRLSMKDIGKLGVLQDRIRDKTEKPSRYPSEDKVFFFQFLISYPDRLLLHHSNQTLDESFNRLNQVLALAKEKPVSPALLGNVKTSLRAIGSLPALIHTAALEIQLPHRGADCP